MFARVLRFGVADLAQSVISAVQKTHRPYAVFVGRSVELMPADGLRFAKLQANPLRMAQCAGVFDFEACVDDVAAALEACR